MRERCRRRRKKVAISEKRDYIVPKMSNRMKSHLLWENFPFRTLVSEHVLEKMPSHVHDDFYELGFVRDGKGFHQLEEEVYPIRAGNLFLIHPGARHAYVNSRITIYNILFEPSFLNHFQQDLSGFPNYQLLFHAGGELPARSRMLSVEPDCSNSMFSPAVMVRTFTPFIVASLPAGP